MNEMSSLTPSVDGRASVIGVAADSTAVSPVVPVSDEKQGRRTSVSLSKAQDRSDRARSESKLAVAAVAASASQAVAGELKTLEEKGEFGDCVLGIASRRDARECLVVTRTLTPITQ